jgi:hypothetical protein
MRPYFFQDVSIVNDPKIEAPTAGHAALPEIAALIEFLGMEGRMAKVLQEQELLLIECAPDRRRCLLVAA